MLKFEQNLVYLLKWKVKYIYNIDVFGEGPAQARKAAPPRLSRETSFHVVGLWASENLQCFYFLDMSKSRVRLT
jgi:hypothetical protein